MRLYLCRPASHCCCLGESSWCCCTHTLVNFLLFAFNSISTLWSRTGAIVDCIPELYEIDTPHCTIICLASCSAIITVHKNLTEPFSEPSLNCKAKEQAITCYCAMPKKLWNSVTNRVGNVLSHVVYHNWYTSTNQQRIAGATIGIELLASAYL